MKDKNHYRLNLLLTDIEYHRLIGCLRDKADSWDNRAADEVDGSRADRQKKIAEAYRHLAGLVVQASSPTEL